MESIKTHELLTVGKDGKPYKFIVEQSAPDRNNGYASNIHYFKVKTNNKAGDWFEFNVVETTDDVVKVIAMHNHTSDYKGKGIPEAMIRAASKWLGKTIFSSSNSPIIVRQSGKPVEYRTDPATAAWKRLTATEEAIYLDDLDVFIYMKR
jgi:hypothetical protein